MQHHRTAPWPKAIAIPGTRRHEVQRVLLLELVVDPPEDGEPIARLAAVLGFPRASVGAAARVLVAAGLAERGPDGLRASPAARSFEALLPARP